MRDQDAENAAKEMQADLVEIERDLTLRRLLWESAEEWDKLSAEWTSSPFDILSVDSLQKNVNRFTQTVYMLEKGMPLLHIWSPPYPLSLTIFMLFTLWVYRIASQWSGPKTERESVRLQTGDAMHHLPT